MSAQNALQGGGGTASQEVKVSFSVKINYMLAALRDDIPENWANGTFPPPLMYPTATVQEADVPAFARSYIEHLIHEADVAYHGHRDSAAWRKNRSGDVTDDVRAWAWRVEVAAADTGSSAVSSSPPPPPPAWLQSSIAEGNRWLGVRIASPVMWASGGGGGDMESFRYVRHVLHSLTQALQFEAPERCGMTVSVGIGKRAFSLPELHRLASGFFVTGPLLSTLPYQTRSYHARSSAGSVVGGWIAACKPNAFGSALAAEFIRARAGSKLKLDPNRPILDPGRQLFPEPRRTIRRGRLSRPPYLPAEPAKYLRLAYVRLAGAASTEAIAEMMASSPGEEEVPPACDFGHYNRQQSGPQPQPQPQQQRTTIACRQLAATTDADSVAVWCSLVTSLAVAFLRMENQADWLGLLYCCEHAEIARAGFDVLDLLHALGRTDMAESVQRRIVEKPDLIPWANPPPPRE
ncbi:hypothetical protein PG996_003849 [Apiospora saccharicola]|uniref:Uncharacterized protein n=1 Tax=Apiospora saccharicola TaxID=335842 RepID=A0ABR1W2H3_9PEZI